MVYKPDVHYYLLEVNVIHISCTPIQNSENEVPTEQTTEQPENSTMTAALSIGIICIILLIGIIAAYFVIQFIRKRKVKAERYYTPLPNPLYNLCISISFSQQLHCCCR